MSVRRLTSVGCAVKTKLIFKFLAIWKKEFLEIDLCFNKRSIASSRIINSFVPWALRTLPTCIL